MQKKIMLLTIFILAASYVPSFAQNKSIPKLEIAKGDTYIVQHGNQLFVDTLIMHDKSTIKFDPAQYGVLEAKAVYVGKKCTITSKGESGKDGFRERPGADGADGGNLTLTFRFKELDDLTIDTRGGDGGNGANGKNGKRGSEDRRIKVTTLDANGKMVSTIEIIPGIPGTPGGNATGEGDGGSGGNIMLVYSTNGFIPIFNNSKGRNNISILYTAGNDGDAGKPGKGGHDSQDGEVVYKQMKPAFNGRVSLINVNSEMADQRR